MSTSPLVSVVVPVFNREALLPRALDSVLAQSYGNFECIVADNCSTDGTLSVAESYAARDSRIRVLRSSENGGPVKNWLRGTLEARGPLVKMLFSDDWMAPECLVAAVRAFESHPQIGFVYFCGCCESEDPLALRASGLESDFSFLWRSLVSHRDVPVSPTAAVFRTEDIVSALSLVIQDDRFDYLGTGAGYDQAIYLEAAQRHGVVYYVAEPRVYYGAGPESITIATNARRPGHLMWGYLRAQLAFLERRRAGRVDTLALKAAVHWHLAKLFVRYRIAPRALGTA